MFPFAQIAKENLHYNVFMTFKKRKKNNLICVLKMSESLTGLEQHEGAQIMTEF